MWEDIEWNPDLVPALKLGLHITQLVFSFVIFCLEIVVFKGDKAEINGSNGWTFGVCFLSIPAWIYLSMAPRFPRTRKLAQPHVMTAVDGLYTILWLSAFATQAAYNTANSCGSACSESKAIVGLGFFVFLLFAATTFISIYTVKYYKFHGNLPGYDNLGSNSGNIDPDKAFFSTGPAPQDEEAYAPVGLDEHDHDHDGRRASIADEFDTTYAGAGGSTYSDHGSYGRRDSRRLQDNPFAHDDSPFDTDTEYNPRHQGSVGRLYAPPPADDDFIDDRPAQFPAANYDRVGR